MKGHGAVTLVLLAAIGALAAGAPGLALAGSGWDGVASMWMPAARGNSGASAGRPQRDHLGEMRQGQLLALIQHHSRALTSAWGELERVQGTGPGVNPRGAAHALHTPPSLLAAIRQQAAAETWRPYERASLVTGGLPSDCGQRGTGCGLMRHTRLRRTCLKSWSVAARQGC